MRRYYDRDFRRRDPMPPPSMAWMPGAFMGAAPMYGWQWWAGPYAGGRDDMPATLRRQPPRQSPTYGRGGDEAVRRWAQRYGYDLEMELRPRPRRGGRYGRDY